MRYRFVELVGLSLILAGCALEVTVKTFPAKEIIPESPAHTIDLPGDRPPIRLLYMGCGHMFIEHGGDVIVTDPYFSIQPLAIGKKIRTNRDDYDRYMGLVRASNMDIRRATSVWIAHMHYDHVMDLPILLRDSVLSPDVDIHGNAFGSDILRPFVRPGQFTAIGNAAYDPEHPEHAGRWMDAAPSIRVLPIRSDHAPHVKIGPITIHAMQGDINSEYFAKNFTDAESPTKKKQWKEGDVYAFLVDFLSADTIAMRMYIQTSASHYPLGRPPMEILKDHPVDVAVLCLASSNTVKPYPLEILQTLSPRQTIFIHWEDFFERADFGKYRLVRMTNFKKIAKRMAKAGMPLTREKYVMPQPGTMVTIR